MSYEKELLGFYVTGHPLDAYAGVIAAGNYQTIASLAELADRATFQDRGRDHAGGQEVHQKGRQAVRGRLAGGCHWHPGSGAVE